MYTVETKKIAERAALDRIQHLFVRDFSSFGTYRNQNL